MRFNVEKTFLKYESDQHDFDVQQVSSFLQTEAEDVSHALERVIQGSKGELVDEVRWLPGAQAVAAMREGAGLFMLQLFPEPDEPENSEAAASLSSSAEAAEHRR